MKKIILFILLLADIYNQQIEMNFILKRNVLFLSQNSERTGLKSIKHTL